MSTEMATEISPWQLKFSHSKITALIWICTYVSTYIHKSGCPYDDWILLQSQWSKIKFNHGHDSWYEETKSNLVAFSFYYMTEILYQSYLWSNISWLISNWKWNPFKILLCWRWLVCVRANEQISVVQLSEFSKNCQLQFWKCFRISPFKEQKNRNNFFVDPGYFKNLKKNLWVSWKNWQLASYLIFSTLLRTAIICQNWVFDFWEPWLCVLRTALIITGALFLFLISAQHWNKQTNMRYICCEAYVMADVYLACHVGFYFLK